MTRVMWMVPVLALILSAPAFAQDEDPFRQFEEEENDDSLTPEEAMEMLKEAFYYMEKAEELLNDSSRGKALETEEELMKKLKKIAGEEDPKILTKKVLEKVDKLMEKAEEKQKNAVQKLAEIIKKAKAQSGSGSAKQQQKKEQPGQQSSKPQKPGSPAQSPYDPGRRTPPSKFRSKADKTGAWGNLPPRLRDAMLHGKADIDDYPPEFREALKEYMERLADPDKE